MLTPTVPIINIGPLIEQKDIISSASRVLFFPSSLRAQINFAPIGYPEIADNKNILNPKFGTRYNLLKYLSNFPALNVARLTIKRVNIKNGNNTGRTFNAHTVMASNTDSE